MLGHALLRQSLTTSVQRFSGGCAGDHFTGDSITFVLFLMHALWNVLQLIEIERTRVAAGAECVTALVLSVQSVAAVGAGANA